MARTTTGTLADSLPDIRHAARITREYEGHMPNLVETHTLPEGQGTTWNEVELSKLTAQEGITENTVLENPQTIEDSLFSITPLVSGINTLITDRVYRRIDKKASAKIGVLGQNAIQRLKDETGLAVLDGAATSLAGAGTTLTSGHIHAAARIAQRGQDGTEPSMGPWYTVLNSYQIKDIEDELRSGVGTYNVESGLTEQTFRKGFSGTISNTEVYIDDNITTDSNNDAKGGVFAKEAIVMVQGHSPMTKQKDRPEVGGGATEVFIYDEYAYGERSAGNWLVELFSDSTEPTS